MTKNEIITKYGLEKYDGKDKFIGKINYELWRKETHENGIDTFLTLDNQMSVDLDNGKIFWLTIEKIDHNNLVFDKKLGAYRPKYTTKHYEIMGA